MAEIDGVQPTPEKAEEQQADNSWPKPGEEGYVHPDGTPQSVQQLEDNRRAAADRAAAGSVVHGAPLATPGPDVQAERDKAVERAESYDGTTTEQAEEHLTEWIEEKTEEKADEAADDEQAKPAARRTRASRSADTKKE
ncbi:hypothetical protein [Streptosporangium carneum]|uniref:Uncharacterized protein n=1 Tax=Streptosporangium carneum TaxID=47481 RepID=A0A9W6HXP8_9ACTN|nr:hypothetical protein [Streptosporangium carneum]GLK07309.1 hypothetical protein GCM10017600_07140 [Streptosporangium carneum]